jgi:hypothetical protein
MRLSNVRSSLRASHIFALAFACLMFVIAAPAKALMLSVSSPDDTSNLSVGQTFTVDVNLSGLAPGQQLDYLNGSALFTNSVLLSSPVSVTPGSIVPNPLSTPSDFTTNTLPGEADATFNTASASPAYQISNDGVFFAFQLTALHKGAGSIYINSQTVAAGQASDGNVSTATSITVPTLVCDNLSFNVTSVPEPRGFIAGLLATIGCGAYMMFFHKRRNAQPAATRVK